MLAVLLAVWVAIVREPYDEPDFAFLDLPGPLLCFWILRRLALAAVQQLVLQLFLWPVARELLRADGAATVTTAAVFGLLHLPSPAFALGTAVVAAVWLVLYRRCRRLAPLIVSHALLITAAHAMPERLFYDRAAGARVMADAADYRLLARPESRALLRAVTSDRYFAHRGSSERGYVEGLYRDLLGRPASAGEAATWIERLRRGSRGSVAKQMLLAAELEPATLRGREIDDRPLKPGVAILPGSPAADFEGWYDAEAGWRWARTATPAIRFALEPEPERLYVLALACGAAAEQQVDLELDGYAAGSASFAGFAPQTRRFLLEPGQLLVGQLNTGQLNAGAHELWLQVRGERVAIGGDDRPLGLGFRSLELTALRYPAASVAFPDDPYFLEGFSIAEERLRWTDGATARLVYPLRRVEAGATYELRLTAGAFERQRVQVYLNDEALAEWTFEGLYPEDRRARFDAALLRPGANLLELRLLDAASPEGDPRQLGLAFVNLRIYPLRGP